MISTTSEILIQGFFQVFFLSVQQLEKWKLIKNLKKWKRNKSLSFISILSFFNIIY